MRLTTCGCLPVYHRRIARSSWMRLVPSRRLYRCLGCDSVLFVRPVAGPQAFADTVAEAGGHGRLEEDTKAKPA